MTDLKKEVEKMKSEHCCRCHTRLYSDVTCHMCGQAWPAEEYVSPMYAVWDENTY